MFQVFTKGFDFYQMGGYSAVYNKENTQDELAGLQRINLELSNNQLKYEKKIRFWKIISAILATISTILGIIMIFER